jgi:hypothetical protein
MGEGDAGDAGVVVDEAEVFPGGEEVGEGVALAVADFEREEAVFAEGMVGFGDEAAVDVEAVVAGEEGGVGLVVDDLALQGGGVCEGDVGGVRDNCIEALSAFDCCKQIAVDEADALLAAEGAGVFRGDGERGEGDVGCDELSAGEVRCQGDGDGAGAGADVGDAQGALVVELRGPEEDGFDEVLGFGAGDEDGGGDAEVEAVELLVAEEVLEGLAGRAAGCESEEVCALGGGYGGFGMGGEPGAVALERVSEQAGGVTCSRLAMDCGAAFVQYLCRCAGHQSQL